MKRKVKNEKKNENTKKVLIVQKCLSLNILKDKERGIIDAIKAAILVGVTNYLIHFQIGYMHNIKVTTVTI